MHIVKAIYIIYIKDVYDIVYAYDSLQIRFPPVEGVHLLTKGHQYVTVRILGQTRVILRGEPAPIGPDADILTQLELAYIRYEIEYLTIHLPRPQELYESVADKFGCTTQAERIIICNIREV